MAHEIMSVKLCELDDRVARLHSRLRLTETADAGTLDREIAEQERQCAETALTLAQRLAHIQGGCGPRAFRKRMKKWKASFS